MELGKYIQVLLFENDTVIMPGFGAFVSIYRPAEIQEGEMLPPTKSIEFNQQIRNNDGLLVGAIAGGENLSHYDAFRSMEKEIDEIRYQLDKNRSAQIVPLGSFGYNDNGELVFLSSETAENLLLDSFGLEKIELNVQSDETSESEGESSSEILSEGTEKEPLEELEDGKDLVTVEEPDSEDTKKKRRGFWWIFFIIIPLLFAGVYIGYKNFFQDKEIPVQMEEPGTQQVESQEAVIDTVKVDSVKKLHQDTTPVVEEQLPEEEVVKADSLPKYYLIGGSFKVEENAQEYFELLEQEGFNPFRLGKYGNFFIVGIGTYNTEEEALRAKEKHESENPNSGVWVLKK